MKVMPLRFPNLWWNKLFDSIRVTGLLLRLFIENEGGCRWLDLPVSQKAFIYRNRNQCQGMETSIERIARIEAV